LTDRNIYNRNDCKFEGAKAFLYTWEPDVLIHGRILAQTSKLDLESGLSLVTAVPVG